MQITLYVEEIIQLYIKSILAITITDKTERSLFLLSLCFSYTNIFFAYFEGYIEKIAVLAGSNYWIIIIFDSNPQIYYKLNFYSKFFS